MSKFKEPPTRRTSEKEELQNQKKINTLNPISPLYMRELQQQSITAHFSVGTASVSWIGELCIKTFMVK